MGQTDRHDEAWISFYTEIFFSYSESDKVAQKIYLV